MSFRKENTQISFNIKNCLIYKILEINKFINYCRIINFIIINYKCRKIKNIFKIKKQKKDQFIHENMTDY